MAAYAALVSVMQIIHQLQHHPSPPISLDKHQQQSLTQNISSLQEFLDGYNSPFLDSNEADPLEIRIAHAAYAAEDVIESYIVDNIKFVISSGGEASCSSSLPELVEDENASFGDEMNSEEEEVEEASSSSSGYKMNSKGEINFNDENDISGYKMNSKGEINFNDEDVSSGDQGINFGEEISCIKFYEDVQQVIEEMDLINKVAMEIIRDKTAVKAQPQRSSLRSPSSFSGKNRMMVGFDDVLHQLMDQLTREPSSFRRVIPIVGMGGIGKTTLARNVYENAYINKYFDICAWVTISQQFSTKQILSQILGGGSGKSSDKSEEKLGEELHKHLFGRRYLIILDDIWSIEVWEKIGCYFVDCKNGSRMIVTTRQSYLTPQLTTDPSDVFDMKFLDEVNSWKLFSKIVFGESFPLELEEIGKKIVKHCRGLPLAILVIGGLLEKSQHTQESWEHVEKNMSSIVNSENDEYCLRILKMSYNQLPAYLKPCFLYLGVFEEDSKIHVKNLIRLWVSEGFLKPINGKNLEIVAEECLTELVDRNLVLVHDFGSTGGMKYCKMHDLLRDLCLNEALKEGIHNRRLISGSETTFEKVHYAFESMPHLRSYDSTIKTVHISNKKSYGAFVYVRIDGYAYPYMRVGLLPNIRLLRIFNTCPRHKYGEPFCRCLLKDAFHLVNSRYLAIGIGWFPTCEFPSSVNFLWNLHTLIVGLARDTMTAPVEIWKMSQLRHLIIRGGVHLPDPPCSDIVIMEDLQTLKVVCNFKCGEDVVKRIPNIKSLASRYDHSFKGIGQPGDYLCLGNLGCLGKLESLSCESWSDYNTLQYLTFPHSLKKLTIKSLSKYISIGWEEMLEKIGSLPLLQKLQLQYGCFTTQKWETAECQFPSLKLLQLRKCRGLKYWTTMSSSFPHLVRLHLDELSELEEIPTEIGEIPTLQLIRLSSCSESAVMSAKQIVKEQEELYGEDDLSFHVEVRVWDEEMKGLKSLASKNFKVW